MSRELAPLREVLRQAVTAARLRRNTIEQVLELPRGGWDDLLSGRRRLRVHHLLALARLLGVPPEDFLDAALPGTGAPADRRLLDWIDPAGARSAQASSAGDLQALIRDTVRRELDARQSRSEPDPVPGS